MLLVLQARHFKEMLRTAGHVDKVKRMRVAEKAVEGMVPFYEVRCFSYFLTLFGRFERLNYHLFFLLSLSVVDCFKTT